MTITIPAKYRYVAFLDLLADAAFQHQLAMGAADSYTKSRHARASIVASALTVECLANCVLEGVDVSTQLTSDLDKFSSISKLEVCLLLGGHSAIDRGRIEVQRIGELIRARNAFVHPKVSTLDATVTEPQDAGSEWMIPISMDGEFWPALGMPKQAMFWDDQSALAALKAVCSFSRYVLVDIQKAPADGLWQLLSSRIEVGKMLMPAIHEEVKSQILGVAAHGAEVSFLATLLQPSDSPEGRAAAE